MNHWTPTLGRSTRCFFFLFFLFPLSLFCFNGTWEAARATHPTQLIELAVAGEVWEQRLVVCVVQENMWCDFEDLDV